jgi:hypothetical protein
MKFFLLQGKKSKVIYGELTGVLEEASFSLATVKRSYRRFKQGNFSLNDES